MVEIVRLVADDEFSLTTPLLLELIALFVEMLIDASEAAAADVRMVSVVSVIVLEDGFEFPLLFIADVGLRANIEASPFPVMAPFTGL